MDKNYLRWTALPYAGESNPPRYSATPLAGSWPLVFLKRDSKDDFLDPAGKKLHFPITSPNVIDFDKELHVVRKTLHNLTPEQKKIGTYYGTGVPTKQWTPVIDRLIDAYDVSPLHATRILASVHGAINDTMIIVWDLKYKWDVARPNQYDYTLRTLLCTPNFPTYPSGHATLAGCCEVVLSYFFPKEAKKLKRIAEDNAHGRLYAGVHFPSDNDQGLVLGRYLGKTIVEHLESQNNVLELIDNPHRDNQNAAIFPKNYHQFIPYDFEKDCHSLLIGNETTRVTENNINAPKPFLFR
ncbi:vanadium-dependent haloperoxidase [Paraliobacillus zengyii]|uniref:vanadium-dependent haloperoxidase n=2 Tax=Paraliobacillus TaxID=200903 RepID=UPI000DD331C7|nr:vanadium-dependent haloperoxidase [Paraliobacillus zengyii]